MGSVTSDISNEMESFREVEEELVDDEVNEIIHVAVRKNWRACKSVIDWALENSKGKKLCLVHVHQPSQFISMMGANFPVSSFSEQQLIAHREQERQEVCKILDEYLRNCSKARVQVDKLYIEKDTIESGLVELISQHKIERLVMGAADDRSYSRKMTKPKSKKAIHVCKHAPSFCHIWFTCKGQLIFTREGAKKEEQKMQSRLSQFSSVLSMSNSQSSGDSEGSFDGSSTFSLSQLFSVPRPSEAATDSTFYHSEADYGELSFRSYLYSPIPEEHLLSSPSALEGSMYDALYDQFDQAIAEADTAKQAAFENSMRDQDTVKAIRKANAAEKLYYEEVKRRKEVEEELAKTKAKLEYTKKERDMALDELRVAVDQKLLLKSQAEEFDYVGKEIEETLISALELLQSIEKV